MRLRPAAETLHGWFDAELPPALTVEAGSTVTIGCLDSGWSTGPFDGGDLSARERHPAWEPGAGHALAGPIAVRGARPGQVLAVGVGDVVPGTFGTTYCGGTPRCRRGCTAGTWTAASWSPGPPCTCG